MNENAVLFWSVIIAITLAVWLRVTGKVIKTEREKWREEETFAEKVKWKIITEQALWKRIVRIEKKARRIKDDVIYYLATLIVSFTILLLFTLTIHYIGIAKSWGIEINLLSKLPKPPWLGH